jgi:phage gp16-like protein
MSASVQHQEDPARRRKAELGKIHLAKKRLGLNDEVYREIIGRLFPGKMSAGDLDQTERGKLLDELRRFGFVEGASYTTKLDAFSDREPQARLIRALWADCAAFGAIHDSSERALRSFIKRVGRSDSINWLSATQASAVIEGLKAMKARAGHRQSSTAR